MLVKVPTQAPASLSMRAVRVEDVEVAFVGLTAGRAADVVDLCPRSDHPRVVCRHLPVHDLPEKLRVPGALVIHAVLRIREGPRPGPVVGAHRVHAIFRLAHGR